MRSILEIDDLGPAGLEAVLDRAEAPRLPPVLAGRGVALLFEKPSNRTRSATEMAVVQLGGHPLSIRPDEVGLDVRETVEDVGRTLACYHAAIGARVSCHATLERLAGATRVPVLNLLSDRSHPLQALADLLTLRQRLGTLRGRRLAWVGDFTNVARSLTLGAAACGMVVRVAAPPGYGPDQADLERLAGLGADVAVTGEPGEAAAGADAVATDVWVSMGQEDQADDRRRALGRYTVDPALMARATPAAGFLHCLPAHRGEEVAAEVVDGPRSLVWQEAENRMHVTRGLLAWVFTEGAHQ
ncbi:MAG: ornithine carbamoyltransferase [Acidimicrobiales bacterium]